MMMTHVRDLMPLALAIPELISLHTEFEVCYLHPL